MFKEIKKRLSKGFTLVEILVVLVIVAILAGLAFVSYGGQVDKSYASEARLFLKDVAAGSETFSQIYQNETPTVEKLRTKGFVSPSPALMKKWKVEINGQIYTAISTQEMAGGAGKTIIYDAANGTWSGYGEDVEVE